MLRILVLFSRIPISGGVWDDSEELEEAFFVLLLYRSNNAGAQDLRAAVHSTL